MQQTLRDLQVVFPISHGWGASSVGRALRSQRRGRGFNSPALHQPSLATAAGVAKQSLQRMNTGGSSDEASVSLRHQITPSVILKLSAYHRLIGARRVSFVGGLPPLVMQSFSLQHTLVDSYSCSH